MNTGWTVLVKISEKVDYEYWVDCAGKDFYSGGLTMVFGVFFDLKGALLSYKLSLVLRFRICRCEVAKLVFDVFDASLHLLAFSKLLLVFQDGQLSFRVNGHLTLNSFISSLKKCYQ